MKPTFWPPPVSVVVSVCTPDWLVKLSACRTLYAFGPEPPALNCNQLRLTKSVPAVPVKVTYSRCTPVAVPDRLVVLEIHVCQPPVEVTGTLAMIGPVVESSRYWMVPDDAPDARRVVTEAGDVPLKSRSYASQSPGAM